MDSPYVGCSTHNLRYSAETLPSRSATGGVDHDSDGSTVIGFENSNVTLNWQHALGD